jgi:hypothetical protein
MYLYRYIFDERLLATVRDYTPNLFSLPEVAHQNCHISRNSKALNRSSPVRFAIFPVSFQNQAISQPSVLIRSSYFPHMVQNFRVDTPWVIESRSLGYSLSSLVKISNIWTDTSCGCHAVIGLPPHFVILFSWSAALTIL